MIALVRPSPAGLACRALVLSLLIAAGFAARTAAQSSVTNWYRWEQTLTTTRDYHLNGGNPYRTLLLRVTYTPISCAGSPWCQTFTGYGFWDGGRTFKIRSAFPAGTWSWQVTCSGASNNLDCATDPALDSVLGGGQTTTTATGTVTSYLAVPLFDPSDPYKWQLPLRGFVRISGDQRYLTYGDGVSKIFWSADTAWAPAITDVNDNTRWQQFLDDRASRGFTAVMMAIAPSGDSSTVATGTLFEDVGGNCGTGLAWPKPCSRWRPAYFQKLDEKIRLANEKGLLVVLIGVMDPQGNTSSPKYPAPADAAIFARNLAARLSGSHVIFSPSFDDKLSTTSTLMDWVGCALRDAAPRHLVTAHLAGGSSVADYQTVHNRRWHQLHVFQSGHGFNTADKNPWEDTYEFVVRRARAMPDTLYQTTTGTSPACPNVPAISLPAPYATKPNTNGEAAYDSTLVQPPTYTQLNSQQVDTPQGVRHTGYSSTLNGAFGFTLGVKGIWDWTNVSPATLSSEGSRHMDILSDQFRLLPWESLQRRSSLVKNQKTELYNGVLKPEEDKQVIMAVTSDNNFAMLYLPDNDEVKIDASSLVGFDCNTTTWSKTWVDPRDGQPKSPGTCTNISEATGATRRLARPTCPDPFTGDSGKCDWVVKLQRTSSAAFSSTAQSSGLEVWPESLEGSSGWRITGRLSNGDAGRYDEPFAISEPTQGDRLLRQPVVAQDAQGAFLVVWEDDFDGHLHGIFARRVDGQGRLLDHEFPVNRTTEYDQTNPWAAASPAGGGVVTWTSYAQDGDMGGIFARRVNPAGVPFGGEIQVNEEAAGHQDFSKVGMDLQGSFVVAWTGQDGDAEGVFVRRFDRHGNPIGGEAQVNTTAAGAQFLTNLEVGPLGDFLVIWTGYAPDGSDLGIFGQRYEANGTALGGEVLMVAPASKTLAEAPGE